MSVSLWQTSGHWRRRWPCAGHAHFMCTYCGRMEDVDYAPALADLEAVAKARRRGLAKTTLQHAATAAAISLGRIAAWFGGRPIAPAHTSRFAALAA